MPGPNPKDPGRRARRNERAVVQAPGPPPPEERPEPAKRWLKPTRERWVAFWGSPLAGLVMGATDLDALEELFDLYDERRRYRAAARKQRLVKGSTGQMVLNPLLKEARAMSDTIATLEERFGLGGPLARLRLGIAFGDAARTLDDWNEELAGDDDDDASPEQLDPRLSVIAGARGVG